MSVRVVCFGLFDKNKFLSEKLQRRCLQEVMPQSGMFMCGKASASLAQLGANTMVPWLGGTEERVHAGKCLTIGCSCLPPSCFTSIRITEET